MLQRPACRPHRISRLVAALATTALSTLAVPGWAAKPVPPELPPETLTTKPTVADHDARVYVADVAISHISDGRVRVYDARNGRLLGMVSTAYAGNFALSGKRDELYVATTHLSRSSRGERTDVLEVHDTNNLSFKYEVVLPTKRAQALNYRGLVRPTANGKFVLVQNATPATSITVVDLAGRKVVAEVPTPGCWGVMPAASHGSRFSMLCGDGTVATVTLDDAGQAVDRIGVKLGFAFPAGAELSSLASECSEEIKPKVSVKGADCSFSGLENQCAALLERGAAPAYVAKYCLSAVGQTVLRMICAAQEQYPGVPVVCAGGVMSSDIIRAYVQRTQPDIYFVPGRYSSDNAIGVAVLAAKEVQAWPM